MTWEVFCRTPKKKKKKKGTGTGTDTRSGTRTRTGTETRTETGTGSGTQRQNHLHTRTARATALTGALALPVAPAGGVRSDDSRRGAADEKGTWACVIPSKTMFMLFVVFSPRFETICAVTLSTSCPPSQQCPLQVHGATPQVVLDELPNIGSRNQQCLKTCWSCSFASHPRLRYADSLPQLK